MEQSGEIGQGEVFQRPTATGANALLGLCPGRKQRGERTEGMACNHYPVTRQRKTLVVLSPQHSGQVLQSLLESLCSIEGLSPLKQGLHSSGITAWMLQQRNRPTGPGHATS